MDTEFSLSIIPYRNSLMPQVRSLIFKIMPWRNYWILYYIIIIIIIIIMIIISVVPFTANSGTKAAILPKGRPSIANKGTLVAVLLGMNRCGCFPLLSAPHSLLSIWTNLKRSEKIPGASTRRWGVWIWVTGPSALHRNSPQGLNISSISVFDQIRDPKIPITIRPYTRPV